MKKVNLFVILLLFVASGLFAQNEIKPAKFENVSWHEVVLIDFKPGTIERAKEIIELYKAAGAAAQVPGPETHWFMTGEYNMMLIWTMKGGPADMEWRRSPDGVKWWSEFIRQQGSKEAAKVLQKEYTSLIQKATSYITRKEL
ncbi:hypothetical protein [Sunxiuqinia sp. sy24]|uniref:hypothetical protein n=1 Tax=Sunxiuqinia sp. sy24 TaxID=3461495 RepID=UPI0040452EFB